MASYFGQFQRFNPLSGTIPDTPFKYLPEIARRTRQLLKDRTVDQLHALAKTIDFAIFCHLDELKENEIHRLRESLESELNTLSRYKLEPPGTDLKYDQAKEAWERYFEWDGGSIENGGWLFRDGAEDELDIPTAFNSSEVDALKDCKDWWVELAQEIPDGKPHELFATLSLWLIVDAIHSLAPNKTRDDCNHLLVMLSEIIETETGTKSPPNLLSPTVEAAEIAYKAMDALCFSEHLQSFEKHEKTNLLKEAAKQEDERKQRSMKGQELNIIRHQRRNEAQAKAIKEWEKDYSQFPSAEKAGRYLADWLAEQGFQFEPRTVTSWIRGHAKTAGIKFR